MKILVTGGAGFIGSHLVDALVAKKHQVTVLDNLSTGNKENIPLKHVSFFRVDISQRKSISLVFKKIKPAIVFHLAAQMNVRSSLEDPAFDARTNILGSINIFTESVYCGVTKVIVASTGGAVYGDTKNIPTPESAMLLPSSPYGASKLAMEAYSRIIPEAYHPSLRMMSEIFKRKTKAVQLRLSNVYGPRQNHLGEAGVVALFCAKTLEKKPCIIFGDGKQTRDFVFVEDVVDAFMRSMRSEANGVYNVGTGIETSVIKLYKILMKVSGRMGFSPIHRNPVPGEVRRSALNASKIHHELGWEPQRGLEQGITQTWNYFKGFL